MKKLFLAVVIATLSFVCLFLTATLASAPLSAIHSPFDQFEASTWENEKARFDNFSIQLQNGPKMIGYIYIYAGKTSCQDEALSRGKRAMEWIVGHRGVESERVKIF